MNFQGNPICEKPVYIMSRFLLHASNGGNQSIPPKLRPIIIVVIIMSQLLDCPKDSQCLPPFILSLLFQTSMLPPANHLLLKLVRKTGETRG
ncbi:hypothetical protein QR685DRAFT_569606 [Neurospora intermedia]|uniref:Uncharacterized protein n=1 Tax=Neurospora intermedia TaxID=5142 RepID=A0ABR3DLL6_NEUIN